VVKVGQHDNPVIGKNIGDKVEFPEVGKANFSGPHVENTRHEGQANIGRDDPFSLVRLEERRRWLEVVGSGRVHWRAHRIGEKIELPAESLHENHAKESVDRCLLEYVMIISDVSRAFRWQVVIRARARDKVLVAFNGHRGLVMGVMSRSPSLIRDENKSVKTKSDDVIDPGVW